jgi:hypothetical protein
VRSLYREDGLSQPEIARRLQRHKTWVWRRLLTTGSLQSAHRGPALRIPRAAPQAFTALAPAHLDPPRPWIHPAVSSSDADRSAGSRSCRDWIRSIPPSKTHVETKVASARAPRACVAQRGCRQRPTSRQRLRHRRARFRQGSRAFRVHHAGVVKRAAREAHRDGVVKRAAREGAALALFVKRAARKTSRAGVVVKRAAREAHRDGAVKRAARVSAALAL